MEGFFPHVLHHFARIEEILCIQEKKGAAAEQKSQTDNEPSARATVSLSQSSDTPTKPATQKEAADVYTPGAGAVVSTAYYGSQIGML